MVGGAWVEGAVLDRPRRHGSPGSAAAIATGTLRHASQRYLLVTEGGRPDQAAASWLGAAVRDGGVAEVTLLYVLTPQFRYPMLFEDSPSDYAEPLDVALAHESRLAFDEARAALGLPRDAVREVARIGYVEPVVLRTAASGGYDGVVIGRRAPSGLAAWLRPDPIRVLWRRLPCTLVVVPGGA